MKNLGLTNDKEVSKYFKYNLTALFRNTQPQSIAAVLHKPELKWADIPSQSQ